MGLVAFLVPVNNDIMILSVFLLALMTLVYIALTISPRLAFDCPYRTPLSGGLWWVVKTFQLALRPEASSKQKCAPEGSMVDTMVYQASHKSGHRDVRDHRALCWTVRSLVDDEELEPFMEGIPDVLWSSHGRRNVYDEHVKALLHDPDVGFSQRLENFLRGCDNDLLPVETQFRRRITALKALWAIATMPRRDGLSLEPLDGFDTTLLWKTGLPFKIASYQVSTFTVVHLNVLLSISRDIHDVAQTLVQSQGLAVDRHIYLILSNLDRLPRDLWQSSTDRDTRETLTDLRDHPPINALEKSSWIAQCLDTLQSLSQALVAVQYEIFVTFMTEAAALESWPYEFEATRAIFLPFLDESSVSPDMAGTFSTAFDSIVSHQSRLERYSSHADEILAILLSICESAMADDPTFFPLNLTSYLTTQKIPHSHVVQKCNTLWLCSCLTAQLVALEGASPLLSGPVTEAMWEVAFVLARKYLDSWKYKSTPHVHGRVLEAVCLAAPSRASRSAIALIQTNILNALSPVPHDLESMNKVPIYPILAKETRFSTFDTENAESPQGDEPALSILTMRIVVLADFLQLCIVNQLPYKAVETVDILADFLPSRPGVQAPYQVHFARSWSAVLEQDSTPLILETLSKGKLLSAYWDGPKTWIVDDEYRWLDDPLAAKIFVESLTAYLGRGFEQSDRWKRLAMIKNLFEST
jgi:hypothetical protein